MTRILVVDDEPQILRALRINLKSRTYDVETVANGVDALASAARRLPDAVLLDLGLPDMDGVEVILGLRGWTTVPIVVLSGRTDPQEKIHALDAGADDFVTKPFAMEELLARLRAVIRRHQQANAGATGAETSSVRLGSCDIDLVAHSVARGGDPVRLTRTEWALLEVLLRHPGQLVSTSRLLADVWGNSHTGEAGYLRFHMARLRRKLEDDPQNPRHLMTEYGTGYRFVP
ncbi:two component transcriptional regulator, winged helix family [Catenulispora acidiphila DSM 44928]|uniref:Two component transcriptional regulator, winged helix family n=1 Tax=Catenulispora acidiphila (strain DSM 44928 / JCM 14897 / NBRC 102108 / NRRL B-24433 / ID139908) TaxID=479433 RepID=C7Q1S9_CATAD|nr:response regulator transcription factor [Catenulispora acidiphila]ACU75630.1 two component transcriptional regulator, winged helix family [Catenulispora acidiphila DSM 44928]